MTAILDQMRVLLAIPGSDSDGKLREAAERMWNDFTKNAKNPLGECRASLTRPHEHTRRRRRARLAVWKSRS